MRDKRKSWQEGAQAPSFLIDLKRVDDSVSAGRNLISKKIVSADFLKINRKKPLSWKGLSKIFRRNRRNFSKNFHNLVLVLVIY